MKIMDSEIAEINKDKNGVVTSTLLNNLVHRFKILIKNKMV